MSTQSPFLKALIRLPSMKLKTRLLSILLRLREMLSNFFFISNHYFFSFSSSTFSFTILLIDSDKLFNKTFNLFSLYIFINDCKKDSFFEGWVFGILANLSKNEKKSYFNKALQSTGLKPPTRSRTSVPEDML